MKDRKARYTRRGQFASFLCFFVMAACLGIFRPMGNVDEIWNYTFGNNMASGLVPYRDFNLLQTPAFAAIHGLALNLFGRELLVTRLLGAFLFAGICQLLYLFSARLGARGAVRWILPGTFLILFDYNVFFVCWSACTWICVRRKTWGKCLSTGRNGGTGSGMSRWPWDLWAGLP